MNDINMENKRLIEDHLHNLKQLRTSVDKAIVHLNNETQNLDLNESNAVEHLEASFGLCVKALERRKEELKKKLSQLVQKKKKDLNLQLDHMKTQKSKLEEACRFSEDHLKCKNATEFLLMKNHFASRITELKEHIPNVIPRMTAAIKFKPINMEKEFLDNCQRMGGVHASFVYIPNTKVKTFDIVVGKEDIPIIITLHDFQNRPLEEGGMDIKVEIVDSKNQKMTSIVKDYVASQGCYKVVYTAPKSGEYRASINIGGSLLTHAAFSFNAKTEDQKEKESGEGNSRGQNKKLASSKNSMKDEDYLVERLDLRGLNGANSSEDSQSFKTNEDICPTITMNADHLHPQNELSKDKKTQTNQKKRRKTPRNPSNAFQNFRGTIGSLPMNKFGQTYFEVQVRFFIKRSMRQDLIFEIGLCRKSDVDKYYCIDGHQCAYAICARKCHVRGTVCLQAWNFGRRLCHTPITANSSPGTTYRATYGFLLDVEHGVWVVADARNKRLIVKFSNVDTTKPLWPVFGVYNPDLCDTYLNLRSGDDINSVLELPVDIHV